jgi:choline dehydrogenase-like flavoprotein
MADTDNHFDTHYVIGSGPAGVACAKALLAQGVRVAMLDAGLQLEPEKVALVRQMATRDPAHWTAHERTAIKSGLVAGVKGIGQKLQFNSDFAYRGIAGKNSWRGAGTGLLPSLALGGLSNVWGAAMLPHRDEDIGDWPVKNAALAPHYRAVTEFAEVSAQSDGLDDWFPLYQDQPQALRTGAQAAVLLRNLDRQRDELHGAGWRFGQSRIAVRAQESPHGRGCTYCRECMGGCVYECIYNSAFTVREMLADKKISYHGNVIVKQVREQGKKIIIEGVDWRTNAPLKFEGARGYLAAGVVPTAQIFLRSQAAYDRPLILRDSQYFMLPLLTARRTPDVQTEAFYTLSQIFLEICQPRVSAHTVHLQLYMHSDIIGSAVRQSLGPLKFLAPLLDGRLIIIQGFLHSSESRTITMTLRRDGENDFLQLEPQINPETRPAVKRVVGELLKRSRALGGMVLPSLLQILEPGRSFHSGGSLPMRTHPGEFESDLLGRPHGWSRLHIVDASVLPSIPATTITYSVMANAHRIGTQAAILK